MNTRYTADEVLGRLDAIELMIAQLLAVLLVGNSEAERAAESLKVSIEKLRSSFRTNEQYEAAQKSTHHMVNVGVSVAKRINRPGGN